MEGNEMVNITVLIAGRPYPLKVKASDEAAIRNLAKEINEKVNHFQITYTKKDKQDCLSMALLTYAVSLHKSQKEPAISKESIHPDLSDKIHQLDELLDQFLA